MRKRKINGRFWAAIGLSVAVLCGAVFAGGGWLFGDKIADNDSALPSVSAGADAVSDMGITYPNGAADLGRFPNGFQFKHTDATLADGLHKGTATDDMLTVTVDSTAAVGASGSTWGTKKTDPYVIASISDWELFVQKIAKDTTHGAGKFYALASTLDFSSLPSGVTRFHMVGSFQGTFYGLGFTLKNITCNNWEVYDANASQFKTISATFNPVQGGFGVFGKLQDATVSDLCVENFSFTNIGQIASLGTWVGPCIGGIAGVTYGTRVNVLNCQTSGDIAHNNLSSSSSANTFAWPAGIVGSNIATTLYIYRCSADIDVDAPTGGAFHPCAGGIIGETMDQRYCYVYDCAANIKVSITTSSMYSHIGAAVGWANGTITVENFVGSLETSYTNDVVPYTGALGGCSYATVKKNIYCDGKQGSLTLVPWTTNTGSFSNGNFVKAGNYHATNAASYLDVPAANQFTTRAALLAAAKNAVGSTAASLPSTIWNADNITKSTYDPENSPVRHKLTANVVYRNLKNGNAEDMGIAGAEISAGTRLPTPTAEANHKFVGWTTDVSGKSAPFTVFPAGRYGDQTLYAVWELADGITVDATLAAKNGKTTAAYDDATKIELIPTVKLNGGSPSDVMSSGYEVSYVWKKDGTAVDGATGDTYQPLNVDDSGTYEYEYRLKSVSEPLWFIDRTSDNGVSVTVTPADVSLRSFTVKRASDNSDTFYYGMQLQELTPEGTRFMSSSSRADVAGTVAFVGNYKLDINNVKDDGKGGTGLQVKIKFTPTSNNYQTKEVEVFIYPKELPLNFELSYSGGGTVDHILTTGLEYGNNNTAAKIASDFEAAYAKFLDDYQNDSSVILSVEGKRPYIVGGVSGASEANPISLNDYKTSGASIDNPTDAVTIKISLMYEEYDVTIDADNGVDSPVTIKYGYGIRISQSDWPGGIVPVKDGNEFLGWFVTDSSGALTADEWDPDTTRVIQNVSIKAKWFVQTLTLDRLEVTGYDREGVFIADTALQDGDLTVVAIYTGTDSKGDAVIVRKTLSLGAGGYTLRYQSGNAPYVNSPDVTVSFTDGKTVSETVTLEHVAKKKYDITQQSFRSASYSVDDATKKIPEISSADMGRNGYLDTVTYTYSEGGVEIDRTDVDLTRQATYWITAHFTLRAQYQVNYYVDDIQVSLEIYAGKTTLTGKWDTNSLTYSGAGQHPTITLYLDGETFVPSDDDGITIEYVVTGSSVTANPDTGDNEAVIVGSYQVEARLTSSRYVLKDGTESDEQLLYSFNIVKAKLAKPTAAGELYYNGDAQSVTELLGTTYDPLLMNLTQQYSGTDAGTYRAGVTLKDARNSEWEDGSTTSVSISWQIKKQVLYATWNPTTVLLGQGGVPAVTALEGLIGLDQDVDLTSGVLVYSGTNTMPTEVGTYQISVRLNNAALSKNYTIDAPSSVFDFVVVPDESVIVIDVQWDANSFTFDGASHGPTAIAVDMDGNEVAVTFTYAGDTSAKWAKDGGYTVTVSAPDGYYIRKGAECKYNIVANDEGKGGLTDTDNPFNPSNNPDDNNPDDGKKPDDGNTDPDKKPSDGFPLPADMPWWQLGLGLLSVILIIVFTSKGAKYGSERKKCIKETTKVMAGSFASPVLLLALFGLSNTIYTIVACALAGLMVLSLIYMIVQKRRFVKAEEGLSKAQDERKLAEKREQEEKLFQQEEERRRRDEEFKMMMASMMNPNAQMQGGGYMGGDIKEIVGDVVASLMPAMQQTMQALPAPDNSELRAVIEQQQQMIEQMMNNQQQLQALPAPDSGAEERMREMEYRMAEQQRLAEERYAQQLAQQQAMMAEQQRLAEERAAEQQRLADERMAQMMAQMAAIAQSAPQPQTVVQQDDGLRDILEKHGEMLNDLMSKENVNNTVVINKEGRGADDDEKVRLTLAEAYEKLTDPLKKVFDAARDYITRNQEVVASEGKFAITYKYRGKQYLKLNIKRGYPTISYSTEGEQLRTLKKKAAEEEGVKVRFKMSELQIFDDSTLEVAKGVIDLRREQIDKDIEFMKKKK